MYGYDTDRLVGRKVEKIFMNKDSLRFETDKGPVVFGVDGDCCSTSYFYDFYGVANLLKNGPVTEVKSVPLDEKSTNGSSDEVQCYGYQITTESPEWGQMTSVFSFRNYSNGYYGGSLTNASDDTVVSPEVTEDVIEIKD